MYVGRLGNNIDELEGRFHFQVPLAASFPLAASGWSLAESIPELDTTSEVVLFELWSVCDAYNRIDALRIRNRTSCKDWRAWCTAQLSKVADVLPAGPHFQKRWV